MRATTGEEGYEQFRVAEKSHGNWMKLYLEGNASEVLSNMGKKVLKQYLDALKAMSSALSRQLGKYDMYSMVVGMILIFQVLLLLLLATPEALSGGARVELPLGSALLSLPFYLLCLLCTSVHMLVCTSTENSCYLCGLPWSFAVAAIVVVSATLCLLVTMAVQRLVPEGRPTSKAQSSSDPSSFSELDILLLTGTLGHLFSLGASSFIEEEHQSWYFLLSTLCLAIFQDVCRTYFSERRGPADELCHPHPREVAPSKKWLALATPLLTLACCRFLRSLNQTGVQWAHLPDLGHWLTSAEHKVALSLLSAASLALILILVQHRCSLVSKIALALGLLGVYSYRAAVGNVLFPWQHNLRDLSKGTVEARFVYVFVLGILFSGAKDLLRSQVVTADVRLKARGLWEVYSGLVLLASLLFRPHNLPVLSCSLLIQTAMRQFIWWEQHYDAAQITIMHYWFGQAFFYFQGNSNNIATVDISAGFVGLDTYVEAPAIFLTAFSTYAGPLLWACHLVCYLSLEHARCFCPSLSSACLPNGADPGFKTSRLFPEVTIAKCKQQGTRRRVMVGVSENRVTDSLLDCIDLALLICYPPAACVAPPPRSTTAMAHGCYCFALLRSIPAAAYVILVTALRYHLFIWSVFSPKLLYEAMHTLVSTAMCLFLTVMDQNHGGRP
ncbi:hypothetical protein Z043_101859 [Scleropages formosus]|uniref:GPI ethanolamine phosphate transferase 2 C-terminal domain-containing protein n=1 Tax=Scleropages formosus TaxID=113540 RepID=A0A0P7UW31_SCLFO|nr:hypothetical protein Z043_101859 [Scleropages formosus]